MLLHFPFPPVRMTISSSVDRLARHCCPVAIFLQVEQHSVRKQTIGTCDCSTFVLTAKL